MQLTVKTRYLSKALAVVLSTATLLPLTATSTQAAINGNTTVMNNTLNYGLLNFSASASKKVSNDQINANLTKTVQSKSSSDVANQIATTLNQAVSLAKKYPHVQIATGNQVTYPQYDKNQKIIGWTGNANLSLKSTDTVEASKLIADLQAFMNLDGLDFSVSDETRKKVEQELMVEASKNFQHQAQSLLPAWNAKDYQLVNLEFNQGNDFGGRGRAIPMMAMAKVQNDSVASQEFQAGDTTISVTANGTVQLIK